MKINLRHSDSIYGFRATRRGISADDGPPRQIQVISQNEHQYRLKKNEVIDAHCFFYDDSVEVIIEGRRYSFDILPEISKFENAESDGAVRSPLPGNVIKVMVSENDRITAGEPVAVIEAMKMEHTLTAGLSGIVSTLSVKEGDSVAAGHTLAVIEEVDS